MNVHTLFYRTSNPSNTDLDLNNIKKNGLPNESLLCIDNSKTQLLPTNFNSFQIRPLVDLTIKLEDIVPSMYRHSVFKFFLKLLVYNLKIKC